jgi:hypothetical protein
MGSTHVFGAKGQTLSASSNIMAAGNYPGATLSAISTDLLAANVVAGKQIFGVTGAAMTGALPNTGQTIVYQTGDNGSWVSSAGVAGITNRVFYTLTGATLVANPGATGGNLHALLDLRTQLMWVGIATPIGAQPMNWATAVAAANAFSLGQYGAGQWRLPNIKELFSLMNYATTYGAGMDWYGYLQMSSINPGQYCWSSTTTNGDASTKLGVDWGLGTVRQLSSGGTWNVTFVRGGPL